MENIGQTLANIRKSANLNQKEIAALVKRSNSYISRIERGEREITPALIADWLKVCKPKIGWSEKEYLLRIKDLQQRQNNIELISNSVDHAKNFFTENYVYNSSEFKEAYNSADELSVIGMGQSRMLISYAGDIRRILSKGGNVNFILCNPDGPAIEMAANIEFSGLNMNLTKQEHWSAIGRLASLGHEQKCTGKLSIKLMDFLPAYTMYGFNLSNPAKAKIFIWITTFKETSEKRPGFSLSVKNAHWFNFFTTQFQHFENWEGAKPLDFTRR